MQVRTLTSQTPAHGGVTAAWQQRAGGLCLPASAAAVAGHASSAGSGSCRELAAAAGLRPFSSSARESLQGAAQRIKLAASSSAEAVRAAGSAVARVPGAVYGALPASAQRLISASQSPSSFHRVLSLQLTAFWQHYGNALLAGGAGAACYLLWRGLCRVAQVRCPGTQCWMQHACVSLLAGPCARCVTSRPRLWLLTPLPASLSCPPPPPRTG